MLVVALVGYADPSIESAKTDLLVQLEGVVALIGVLDSGRTVLWMICCMSFLRKRVFIVYNDREKLLFSPVLTFEQKFNILVFIVVSDVRPLVRKQELYAGPRNPNV